MLEKDVMHDAREQDRKLRQGGWKMRSGKAMKVKIMARMLAKARKELKGECQKEGGKEVADKKSCMEQRQIDRLKRELSSLQKLSDKKLGPKSKKCEDSKEDETDDIDEDVDYEGGDDDTDADEEEDDLNAELGLTSGCGR